MIRLKIIPKEVLRMGPARANLVQHGKLDYTVPGTGDYVLEFSVKSTVPGYVLLYSLDEKTKYVVWADTEYVRYRAPFTVQGTDSRQVRMHTFPVWGATVTMMDARWRTE